MNSLTTKTERLLELLGHDEMPFGLCYSGEKPDGFGPRAGEIITRERELANDIDWKKAFDSFTCFAGSVWLARKKRKAAWISHAECGCMGGGYYTGMYAPYVDMIVQYVSTGIAGTHFEGEHYLPSPEVMRTYLEDCAPPLGSEKYCVLKPLEQFSDTEFPLSVTFFVRGEVLVGLHSLTCFTAGSHNAVEAPFGALCTSMVAWPLVYEQRGMECGVLGGFDPSARKFLKPDEMSFSVPLGLYRKMLDRMETSMLPRHTWEGCRKKVMKSNSIWAGGEDK